MTNIITVAQVEAFRKKFLEKCRGGCRDTMVGLDSQNASCLAMYMPAHEEDHDFEYHLEFSEGMDYQDTIRTFAELLLREYLASWPIPLITILTHYLTTVPIQYLLVNKTLFNQVSERIQNEAYLKFFENLRYVMYPSKMMVEKWNIKHGRNGYNGRNPNSDDPVKHQKRVFKCIERMRRLSKRELVLYEIVP